MPQPVSAAASAPTARSRPGTRRPVNIAQLSRGAVAGPASRPTRPAPRRSPSGVAVRLAGRRAVSRRRPTPRRHRDCRERNCYDCPGRTNREREAAMHRAYQESHATNSIGYDTRYAADAPSRTLPTLVHQCCQRTTAGGRSEDAGLRSEQTCLGRRSGADPCRHTWQRTWMPNTPAAGSGSRRRAPGAAVMGDGAIVALGVVIMPLDHVDDGWRRQVSVAADARSGHEGQRGIGAARGIGRWLQRLSGVVVPAVERDRVTALLTVQRSLAWPPCRSHSRPAARSRRSHPVYLRRRTARRSSRRRRACEGSYSATSQVTRTHAFGDLGLDSPGDDCRGWHRSGNGASRHAAHRPVRPFVSQLSPDRGKRAEKRHRKTPGAERRRTAPPMHRRRHGAARVTRLGSRWQPFHGAVALITSTASTSNTRSLPASG